MIVLFGKSEKPLVRLFSEFLGLVCLELYPLFGWGSIPLSRNVPEP